MSTDSKYGKFVGYISVDSGLCWVGDPCYILHTGKPKAIGKTWSDFVETMYDLKMVPMPKQIGKAKGSIPATVPINAKEFGEGVGVCVHAGVGDGFYPVFVKEGRVGKGKAKRVKAVTVLFIEKE